MHPDISINDLWFEYPDGYQALKGINLQIDKGEKVALIGPNGAGKSTLLLHFNGILQGKGHISICGLKFSPAEINKIRGLVGVVFQSPDDQLFCSTIYEDVAYGPIYQGLDAKEIHHRVEKALSDVNLLHKAQKHPFHLSGGEKKRAALASVLSMQPEILVLDEPSAGLDPRARRELIALLQQFSHTMVIATHDLDLAMQLTHRAAIINDGKVAAEGDTRQIVNDQALLLANGL